MALPADTALDPGQVVPPVHLPGGHGHGAEELRDQLAMVGTAVTVRGTDPYPWPYDGCLVGANLALVIAGVQQHWYEYSVDADRVAAVLGRVARALHAIGGVVVLVQHCEQPPPVGWPAPAKPHRLPRPDSAASAIPEPLRWLVEEPSDRPRALIIESAGLNGFHGSRLELELRTAERTHLVLGGFGAELTLDTTLRGANDRGFECLVLRDAYAAIEPALGERALASVTMSGGIFGAVGRATDLLAALPPSAP